MTINLGAPKFRYGPGQVNELDLTLPPTPYTKSLGATGGDLEGDSGARAAYVIRRDEFLNFAIRFFETEWPDIVDFIDSVMDGQEFLFFPQAEQDESYFVTLESPVVGSKYEATPDGQYPRAMTLGIVLRAPNFDSPSTSKREYQADFETLQHTLEHASTTRRPDAISFDYLRSAALGPTALADVSLGPAVRKWYVRASGDAVYMARANPDNTAWEAETLLFNYANAVADPILELDFAFTQAGTPVVAAERPSGLWLYWFDPAIPGNAFINLGPGRAPKCLLDNLDAGAPDSDVLVFYVHDTVAHAGDGAICYRVQRERYEDEHETPIFGGMTLDVVSGDPDIHELTGEGINGTDGEEIEGTFTITAPADLNTNGLLSPPYPHVDNPPLGAFMLTDTGIFSYRLVLEFSKPVRNVSLSQFYPLEGDPNTMFIAAVKDRDGFTGIGGAAYVADAVGHFPSHPLGDGGVGPHDASVTVNEGFRYLVIDTPLRGAFGQSHYNVAPTFVGSFDGNIGGTITLPPIEDMFVEDAVKTTDGRVMVIYSGRDEAAGTYQIQKLISGLYPLAGDADPMSIGGVEAVSGILRIALIILEPPGTSDTQYPDVYTDPAEDGADIGNMTATGGTLVDNTEVVLPMGDVPPPTVPAGRFAFHSIDDLLGIGGVLLQSGALLANIIVVVPIADAPPSNVEAVFRNDPTEVGTNMGINGVVLQSGTLITIVITYTSFDNDGFDIGGVTLQSGTLV